tara:strand:- start:279 stop:632 length:354 start_codon:yes stop_codon:yes gene_type:complete
MSVEIITYDKACESVRQVKDGSKKNIVCIIATSDDCPFCFQMTDKVIPQVKKEFNGQVEFLEFKMKDNSDSNFIFPVDTPSCFFYVKGNDTFPIVRKGVAPADVVIKDVKEMISKND